MNLPRRNLPFWGGLLIAVFLGFAWWDSIGYGSALHVAHGSSSGAILTSSSGAVLMNEGGEFFIGAVWISAADSQGGKWRAWTERIDSFRMFGSLYSGQVWSEPRYYWSPASFGLALPHWLILLIYLPGWWLLLWWRAKRRRIAMAQLPDALSRMKA